MTVLITLTTAGADSGPFNLYSNIDGFIVAFESNVSKLDLEAGYTSVLVPDTTSTIRIKSNNALCQNYVDLEVLTTTTSTSSTSSTSTTSTTSTSTSSTTTTSTTTETPPIIQINNGYGGPGGLVLGVTIDGASLTAISGAFPLALGESYSAYVSITGASVLGINVEADDFSTQPGSILVPLSVEICQNVNAPAIVPFNITFSNAVVYVADFNSGNC